MTLEQILVTASIVCNIVAIVGFGIAFYASRQLIKMYKEQIKQLEFQLREAINSK